MVFYRECVFYLKIFEIFGFNPTCTRTGVFCTTVTSVVVLVEVVIVAIYHENILFIRHPVGYINDVIWVVSIFVTYPVIIVVSLIKHQTQLDLWRTLRCYQCSGVFLKRFWTEILLLVITRAMVYLDVKDNSIYFFWMFIPFELGVRLYLLKFLMFVDCFTQYINRFLEEIESIANDGSCRSAAFLEGRVTRSFQKYRRIFEMSELINKIFGSTAGLCLWQGFAQLISDAFFWYWYFNNGQNNWRSNFCQISLTIYSLRRYFYMFWLPSTKSCKPSLRIVCAVSSGYAGITEFLVKTFDFVTTIRATTVPAYTGCIAQDILKSLLHWGTWT